MSLMARLLSDDHRLARLGFSAAPAYGVPATAPEIDGRTPEMDDGAQSSLKQRIARLLAAGEPMPAGRFDGRGIVISAGGAKIFTSAYVLISVLRKTLGCRLPIEVWHFGAAEISPAMAAILAEFDVDLVDATRLIAERGGRIRDGWQLKPLALQWSRFAEVLMLDADQVPVSDPTGLFAWPEYERTGAVFWPDIADLNADNPVWNAVGLPAERVRSLESGQILMDKRRHWRSLSVVLGLNEEAESLYRLVYGDKDTFLIGWRLTGDNYAMVPHRPFADDRMLVQRDFSGAPLFQHRTNAKWNYAGDQYAFPTFHHEAACLQALQTLRARWGGRVSAPPPRSLAARRLEDELLRGGPLRLSIAGDAPVPVALLPHGEIGEGRAYDLRQWHVEESGDGHDLIFSDGDHMTYSFRQAGEGRWVGRRLSLPPVEATVAAAVDRTAVADGGSAATLVDDLLRASGFPVSDPASDAALVETLKLLDRAEPGVARRLERLAAERRNEPRLAARLRRLARDVGSTEPGRDRAPDIGPGIFAMGYAFSHGKPD
jgi:hypothetical protein